MKHVSEYKFLDLYGDVGEYLRLELKLCFRNKTCLLYTSSSFSDKPIFKVSLIKNSCRESGIPIRFRLNKKQVSCVDTVSYTHLS